MEMEWQHSSHSGNCIVHACKYAAHTSPTRASLMEESVDSWAAECPPACWFRFSSPAHPLYQASHSSSDKFVRLAKTSDLHPYYTTMSGTRHLQRNPVMVAAPIDRGCSCQHCTMCDPTPAQAKSTTRFCQHGAQSTFVEPGTKGHACSDGATAAGNFSSTGSSNNWSSQNAMGGGRQTNGNIYNSTSRMPSSCWIGC
jgi:hypothetical protein